MRFRPRFPGLPIGGFEARPRNIFRRGRPAVWYNSSVPKQWECVICGYIHDGEEPPEICPVCDAPKEFFRLLTD